ncbi:MAG: SIR2 family protein [Candidatus Binataceae bacterium]
MATKKLLMLLGTGSSIAQGIPSVSHVDRRMKKAAAEWSQGSHRTGLPNYFDFAWAAAQLYYSSEKPALRPEVNFERVLGDMLALANWMTPAPYGNSLRQIIWNETPLPPSPGRFLISTLITSQLTELLVDLARYMRKCSRDFDRGSDAFREYRALLDGIRSEFDVGIYSLNYDSVALTAWPTVFTGFDASGRFAPGQVLSRREWNFLYHLHGSVYHTLVGPFGNSVRWQNDLTARFDDGNAARSTDERSDGKRFPKTTLIAGAFKLDQLLIEPFHTLYAAFVRDAYEADAILLGGYGFGDAHVNRALGNRLENDTNRPSIMILTYAEPRTDPMEFRADRWSYELCRTLNVSARSFSSPAPMHVADLVANDGFEFSAEQRIAIWHGGFSEASRRVAPIVDWLSGADNSVLRPSVS